MSAVAISGDQPPPDRNLVTFTLIAFFVVTLMVQFGIAMLNRVEF